MPPEPPTQQESHAAFLGALKALGGSAGNGRLRELLEWDETTYQQVKASLVASRSIVPGRGRGGSVALASSNGAGGQAQEPMQEGPSPANAAEDAASSPANGSTGVTTHEASPTCPRPSPVPRRSPSRPHPSRWIARRRRTPPKAPWRRTSGTRPTSSGPIRASRRRSIPGRSWG
jgi:hypothetical protein